MNTDERIKKLEEKWEEKIKSLEAELLEQEHRPFRLLWNFWNRKKNWKNPLDERREATKKALLWRLFFSPTTIALGTGGVIALLTLYFLYQQNVLFENQNNLFQSQNLRIDQQTKLLEASRRSTQMFIMGEVLSDLNRETKETNADEQEISQGLVGRISALSRSMKPYYYLEDSTITGSKLSPERGQLLVALLSLSIKQSQLVTVFRNGDFRYAELNDVVMRGENLEDIKLDHAEMQRSTFIDVDFSKIDGLTHANLRDSHFESSSFDQIGSSLDYASFSGSYFGGDTISSHESGVYRADFSDSRFSDVTFRGSFQKSDFTRSSFYDVILKNVSFQSCDFSNAFLDLSEESSQVSFDEGCLFDSTIVGRNDWFSYMADKFGEASIQNIRQKYYLDTITWREPGAMLLPRLNQKTDSLKGK